MPEHKSIYVFLFCALISLCVFGFWAELEKQPDSEGYLLFADEILTLQIFDKANVSWASTIRTPGYPALLALSQVIFSQTFSVFLVHYLCGLLAILCFVYRFSALISTRLAILLAFVSFLLWREYYVAVLTEWVALSILIIFFSILPLKLTELSNKRLLSISLVVSFLILLKPAFISLIILLPGLVFFMVPRENYRQAFTCLLTGLLPVFLWAVFNVYRLESFTIAAFSGHNLFGNASLIGKATFDDKPESSRIVRFANYVNHRKLPAENTKPEELQNILNNYQALTKIHNFNVYQVALNFEPESQLLRADYDRLMREYAIRVIMQNPLEYLNLFITGVSQAKRDLWLILVSIVCLIMMIKSGHQMSIVLATALAAHISHLCLVSFMQIAIERYYLLTLIPLGLFTLVALLSATVFNSMDLSNPK